MEPHPIITYRQALTEALSERLAADPTVFLMGEDIGGYGGSFDVTAGLLEIFGKDRIRDTPISEAAITGAAVGAALAGMRPVVEIMFSDFLTLAMDALVNQAAKSYYMYGGQQSVPLTVRTPAGSGTGAAAQHSQSLEAWLCHVPGLKVVYPSTPADAKGLLTSAILDDNPVIFFEHKLLYDTSGPVPTAPYTIPLGTADTKRKGDDYTILTYGAMVGLCLSAADQAAQELGVEGTVLDLRTLSPLDTAEIRIAAAKTGRVLIVHEACKTAGLGAELSALICESPVFHQLKAPIHRVCGADVPMPYSQTLEQLAIPTIPQILAGIHQITTH